MKCYFFKACNHVQQDEKNHDPQIEEKMLKMQFLNCAKTCSDQDNNHQVIKKKFSDILSNTFVLVPHHSDLYYYCPGTHHHSDDLYASVVPSR